MLDKAISSLTLNVRFSLLLLEFGEVYFEDFTVVYYPYTKREEIEERLFSVIIIHACLFT